MTAVRVAGLAPDFVPYSDALALQRRIHSDVVSGTRDDTLILLEHTPVYTAGRRTLPAELPTDGSLVIDVDRGGKITWHGPGQLVGYPIVRLADPVDVVAHVRRLEAVLIEAVAGWGVAGFRVPGRSGVWVDGRDGGPARKLAAIGVRVESGVTLHGFALNCNNDLGAFSTIIPCGIPDAGVTSLSEILGRDIAPHSLVDAITDAFGSGAPVDHPEQAGAAVSV